MQNRDVSRNASALLNFLPHIVGNGFIRSTCDGLVGKLWVNIMTSDLPNRKLQRLANYDYSSPNYYFVTLCTSQKCNIFGSVNKLSKIGIVAENELCNIEKNFDNVIIDKYVVMPNHVHAIIVIQNSEKTYSLSQIIGWYKAGVARKVHKTHPDINVWQKSFYDRIIRGDSEYVQICKYIDENKNKLCCLRNGDI